MFHYRQVRYVLGSRKGNCSWFVRIKSDSILGKAFTAFFEGRARRPKFKCKKRSKPSFYLANDQFELGDHRLWIPKLGWVNMAENFRFQGKITGARITKTAA